MKILTLFALLNLATAYNPHRSDDEGQVVKVTSHQKHKLSELIDMMNAAEKRNLRGQVDINDLTNCSPDDNKPEQKNGNLRHMREKSIKLEYTYEPKDKK